MSNKVKRIKYEHRDRQVTIATKPSTYLSIQKIATMVGCSSNNIINMALEEYVAQNMDKVKQYDTIKNEEDT